MTTTAPVLAGDAPLGVDVGGTFTDLAMWDGEKLRVGKTTSTPDQSDGVLTGSRQILDFRRSSILIHGSTVATNALLERSGVPTALVTDAGFEDLIEIGRQDRPSLYDATIERSEPLVPRQWRIGWGDSAVELVGQLGVGAVAVAFLNSYRDPSRELSASDALAKLGIPVVAAHTVVAEFREYERISTTVVNAYLQPRVASYLRTLQARVVPELSERMMVMRSSGGLISPAQAGMLSASILLSGPAGGVVGATALGRALGYRRVISFDMGGTSTDVCRIEDGRPEVAYERAVDGLAVRMPSLAVHTVGAGGGSIGWVDPGGALQVGPQSAGAHPGPASYGRGGLDPTVTDAHVVLGRLAGNLADGVALDRAAGAGAMSELGLRLGLGAEDTALGVLEVVESTMERAVRRVSVEEGADPAEAFMVAFGGAGGLHAVSLARRLGMAGVIVPPHSGVFSALGLLLAPPRADRWQTVLTTSLEAVESTLANLVAAATADLETGTGAPLVAVETSVDVRYSGQSHETPVPYSLGEGWAVLAARFHQVHADRNGFARRDDPVEAVAVRVAAVGSPALIWEDLPPHRSVGDPRRTPRRVVTTHGPDMAPVWWRPGLEPAAEVIGPCVVEDGESVTWLEPGDRGVVLDTGALQVTW